MTTTPRTHTAPFDAVAARYDEIFTSSKIGCAQRESAWVELASCFHEGDRVLEIGCGTGIDACFLAQRGVRVVASDSSPQMIAIATERSIERGFQRLVQPLLARAEELHALPSDEFFDGAFSNFGAINCIAELRLVADALAKRLKPGAKFLLCSLGPCCLWEIAWYLAHGQPRKAFRRLKSDNIARIANGPPVRVHYPSVRSLARIFTPEFLLRSVKGIGVAVPPSYLEPWANRFPTLLQLASKVDSYLERWPCIREFADHILLTFERRAT